MRRLERRPITALASSLLALTLIGNSGVAGAGTIDPRLLPMLAQPSSAPVHVWVDFRDKGMRSASDLAVMLAQAERDLSPRARARRLRAGVTPLVDELDLPVCRAYLDTLTAHGLAPHAVSRWLNRAAVMVPGAQIPALAELPFVERVSRVSRVYVDAGAPRGGFEPVGPRSDHGSLRGARSGSSPAAGARVSLDHGLLSGALQQMNVPAVHDSGYTGAGVLICILDAGFNWHDRHEALLGQIIAPGRTRDFVDGDTTVTDTLHSGLTHGTTVMGCLAGNAPGRYVGAAFGAEFALARTENDDLFFERPVEMLWWGMGAEWADSLGADIISSSLGYFQFDGGSGDYTYADMNGHTTIVSRAAEIAASKGILVVNAVGNYGQYLWHYLVAPADVNGDSLIAVGAVGPDGQPTSFSSFGPSSDGRIKPDVMAPGNDLPVVSTERPSGGYNPTAYESNSGTSLAAPLVAGLAACLMQARPSWSPQQVIRVLRETASRATAPDNHSGYGVVNGLAALRWPAVVRFDPRQRLGLALRGPNPRGAADATTAVFALAASATEPIRGRVRVFDACGRVVRDLWAGTLDPGRALEVTWDGRDDDRRSPAPGLFWIAVEAGRDVAADRVVLLR